MLERAILDGEVRRGLDVDVAPDLFYGPLFFGLLIGHAQLDARFMDQVLAHALRGLGPPEV